MYWLVPETNGVPLEDMDVLFEAPGFAPQQMKFYKSYVATQNEIIGVKQGDETVDAGKFDVESPQKTTESA